jgi:hypothetical protein
VPKLTFEVNRLVCVRSPLQKSFALVLRCLFSFGAYVLGELLKPDFQRIRLLKAFALDCHRVLLIWWLKSTRVHPIAHVSAGLGLTCFPKNVVAPHALRKRICFFAELLGLFAETFFDRFGFETPPLPHGALLSISRRAGAL